MDHYAAISRQRRQDALFSHGLEQLLLHTFILDEQASYFAHLLGRMLGVQLHQLRLVLIHICARLRCSAIVTVVGSGASRGGFMVRMEVLD